MRERAWRGAAEGLARRIDRPLALFGVSVAAASALLAALGAALLHHRGGAAPETVPIALGDVRATVPGRWLRARSGEGIALVLEPGDLGLAAEAAPPEGARILVHLAPADDAPDPADRPRLLYAPFLAPEASAGPGDLVRRAFRAGTPYEGEALYLAPPDGRGFAARCAPAVPPGQAECAAAFRLGGVEVRVGLPAALLPHGPAVVARLAGRLGGA